MNQYTSQTFTFAENDLDKIAVIRVDIDQLTGKQSGFNRVA
jgi:hypothetical protein